MGSRTAGNPSPTGGGPHVHYSTYLDFNSTTATGNKIDPLVYWTPGLNPFAPTDAQGNPTGTGLHAYATPVTDWDQNGSIDTQGALSESGGFVREGQSSILKLGVNTPHTKPLTLRINFSERPQGFDASPLDGVDSISWDGNTLLVTLSATVNQATPNTAGHILLQFAEESDATNVRSESITYTVSVDGPAGAAFGSAPAQSLFLIDNDIPQAPADITEWTPLDPDATLPNDQRAEPNWEGLRNGTPFSDREGSPDNVDLNGNGGNDIGAIHGTAGAERIHGQAGDDDIFGRDGGDFLYGDAGEDYIDAGTATTWATVSAYLNGGTERDVLVGGEGNDYLIGGPDDTTDGDDALQGGAGDDTLLGGFGNDVLAGGAGADVLKGGEGDDHLFGSATYRAQGRNWTITRVADVIANPVIGADGGRIYYTIASGFSGYRYVADAAGDALFGEKGSDQLEGGAGADYLDGGDDADLLWGLAGDDVIVGGAGNDIANGGFGDDALFGGDGNDDLSGDRFDPTTGQEGNDYLDGGTGDDKLHGHGGNDTYYFSRGYGKDEVFDSGGTDIIRLGAGILPNAVQLTSTSSEGGAELVIKLSTGDTLVAKNWWHAANTVEYVQFDDGTVWDETVLSQKSGLGTQANNVLAVDFLDDYQAALLDGSVIVPVLHGADGDDTLIGATTDDTLFGGTGADLLSGEAGDDRLQGGAGDDTLFGGVGDDLLFGEEGNDSLQGGEGNDQLVGGEGADVLDGGAGDDVIYRDEFDTVVFRTGDGHDQITSAPGGLLRIEGVTPEQLALTNVAGTDGYQYLTLAFGDDSISVQGGFLGANQTYEIGGSTLTQRELMQYAPSLNVQGRDSDDTIYGGNQNDTLDGAAGNDVLYGQGGNDALRGGAGHDTLTGGTGNDTLNGGAGDDIYAFGRGDGQDTVLDATRSVFRFAAGIAPDAAQVSQSMGDDGRQYLRLAYGDGDVISIRDGLLDLGQTYDFNGTILTQREMLQQAAPLTVVGTDTADTLTGSQRNDILLGNAGADVLEGRHGNDSLEGGLGNDTYLFNLGDGQDTLTDYDPTAGNADVLRFGAGIRAQDLRLEWIHNDLVVRIGSGGERITVKDWFESANANRLERFEFADGTSWNESAIADRIIPVDVTARDAIGTAGDDILTGGAGNDWLEGSDGNDRLYGLEGNDTLSGGFGDDSYYFEMGDGRDEIYDSGFDGGNQIVFGPGIQPDDIRIAAEWGDYYPSDFIPTRYISVGTDGDFITAIGQRFIGLAVARFAFADGTVLTYDEMVSRQGGLDIRGEPSTGAGSIVGTPSDETFVASGSSLIRTGGGNNNVFVSGVQVPGLAGVFGITVLGGGGHDTYHYGGATILSRLTVVDTARPGAGNTLRFGGGISRNSLRLQFGSFAIKVEGGGEIHMPNFDPNNVLGVHAIDTFEFEDGTVLSYAELIAQGFDVDGTEDDDILEGTNVTDRITGFGGDDTLTGGVGDDVLTGGEGNDTYYYNFGDGSDTLNDSAGTDILVLGAGIAVSDLLSDASGGDLLVQAGSDTLTIRDWFLGPDYRIENIRFADGSSYDAAWLESLSRHVPELVNPVADRSIDEDNSFSLTLSSAFTDADLARGDTLSYSAVLADGTALPAWLGFDPVNGILAGLADNSAIGNYDIRVTATDSDGQSVSDTFTLTVNNTNDTPIVANSILDQSIDEDAPFSFTVPSNAFFDDDLIHGDTLTLSAVLADGTDLPAWLSFDAATGTFSGTPDNGDVGSYEIQVTAIDLTGTSVSDVFSLTVNNVNDAPIPANPLADQTATEGLAFSYALSGDTFVDDDTLHGDVLAYEAVLSDGSVLPSWLSFDTATQTFTGTASADSTLIGTDDNDILIDTDTGIANTWDITVTATDTAGISASDRFTLTLQGVAGNDTLDGGKGNDVLNGGGGNDTYLYNLGDGLDTLTDRDGTDTVQFGAGFNFNNTVIRTDSGVAHLRFLDTDGNEGEEGIDIALNPDGASPIEAFAFQDGSTYTLNDLLLGTQTLYGTKKADTLLGDRNDDTIYAGKGGDTVYGRTGNDTLYGEKGNDTLYGEGGHDTLYGGKGKDLLDGGAGDDLLDGGKGHNTLIGGKGNDTLILGKGEDTVRFNLGDGWDTLQTTAKDPEDSDIHFGQGITQNNLWFSRNGDDLRINVLGTNDGMTFENWYVNKHKPLEEIHTSTGELEAKQIERLVQAMAGFIPAPGSGTPLPTEMPQELQATLAGAWEAD